MACTFCSHSRPDLEICKRWIAKGVGTSPQGPSLGVEAGLYTVVPSTRAYVCTFHSAFELGPKTGRVKCSGG